MVKLLLPEISHVEVNYGLYLAVQREHQSVVSFLLAIGADPNFEIHTICDELSNNVCFVRVGFL